MVREARAGRDRRERLFFAVLPDPASAKRLAGLGRGICDREGLRGPPSPAAKLHVSLLGFEVDEGLREPWVSFARRLGSAVSGAAFEVDFVKAASFNSALVLPCVEGSGAEAALTGLRDRLWYAAEDLGQDLKGPLAFSPHLTLAYGQEEIPEMMLEEPVGWWGRDVVLLSSWRGRHTHLGRWSLGPARDVGRAGH